MTVLRPSRRVLAPVICLSAAATVSFAADPVVHSPAKAALSDILLVVTASAAAPLVMSQGFGIFRNRGVIFGMLLVVSAMVSVAAAEDRRAALLGAVQAFELFVIPVAICALAFTHPSSRKWLIRCLIAGLAFGAVLEIIQATQTLLALGTICAAARGVAGGFQGYLMAIGFAYAFNSASRHATVFRSSAPWMILAFLFGVAVLLTGTRGAWLALATVLVVLSLFRPRAALVLVVLGLALTACLGVLDIRVPTCLTDRGLGAVAAATALLVNVTALGALIIRKQLRRLSPSRALIAKLFLAETLLVVLIVAVEFRPGFCVFACERADPRPTLPAPSASVTVPDPGTTPTFSAPPSPVSVPSPVVPSDFNEADHTGAANLSNNIRLQLAVLSLDFWRKSPGIGIGQKNFRNHLVAASAPGVPRDVPMAGLGRVPIEGPHNHYLRVLVEQGLLGIGALIALALHNVRAAWRWTRRLEEEDRFVGEFALASLAVVGVFCMFAELQAAGALPFLLAGILPGSMGSEYRVESS